MTLVSTIKLIKDIAADNGIILTNAQAKGHARAIAEQGAVSYEAIKQYFLN